MAGGQTPMTGHRQGLLQSPQGIFVFEGAKCIDISSLNYGNLAKKEGVNLYLGSYMQLQM